MSTLYSDRLIEITDEAITFRNYSWWFSYRPRSVELSQITRVEARPPSFGNGKWRLFGTSGFRTWFPLDWRRPSRDRIFVAFLRDSRVRIGFTVEDSKRVEEILRPKGLLRDKPSA